MRHSDSARTEGERGWWGPSSLGSWVSYMDLIAVPDLFLVFVRGGVFVGCAYRTLLPGVLVFCLNDKKHHTDDLK